MGGRFKVYPRDAVDRGEKAYNSTCGCRHGARGKGGNAGPDLIVSLVLLHDEDAKNGQPLWHAGLLSNPSNAPQTYMLDGRQYVAVGAGEYRYTFVLQD